ncbi:alpha-2-macroglobulin family protein [Crocinitomix algicola]|uniref:alpha-2-macroglobulin family protein n=1 Tax=Crocinitomix algicola TaxID=1740263 RepID=UPI000872FA02|nr:alpha-2-macroglobulin family protein [Crocinitomix algicola]
MKVNLTQLVLSIFFLILSGNAIAEINENMFNGDDDYHKHWKKVDSLEQKGLYRLALKEVKNIFLNAVDERQHQQVIKSVLFELRYNSYLEEDDYVMGIYQLESLIPNVPSPSKQIFHSLLAEVYWGYYSSNIWKFSNRTSTVNIDLKDVRTWDLKRIATKIRWHYIKSLTESNILQNTLTKDYDAIMSGGYNTATIRPTLYDFLGNRAFDFFKGQVFQLPGSAKAFVLDDINYFGTNSQFLNLNPATKDSLNTRFIATKILYALTAFNSEKGNKEPLFYNTLDRLTFMRTHAVVPNKEKLYLKGLKLLFENNKKEEYAAEAAYLIAEFHAEAGRSFSYHGDQSNKDRNRMAADIAEEIIEEYPNSYGARQCQVLLAQLKSKNFELKIEDVIQPNRKQKYLLEYRNVSKAYVKVVKTKYDAFYGYSGEEILERLKKLKPVFESAYELNGIEDFNLHGREIELPELDLGHYYILVGSNAKFEIVNEGYTFLPFWVSNLTYQHRSKHNDQEIIVLNRENGKPVKGANVEVAYKEYNYNQRRYKNKKIGTFKSDKNGRIAFPNVQSRSYFVSLTLDNDEYVSDRAMYARGFRSNVKPQITTYFFTDRKIYRPGQTIYFKGIMVNAEDKNRSIVPDLETEVVFYDVNHQVIGKQKVKSNKFGSFEGEFIAPVGVLNGRMQISDSFGSTFFNVEEYKRPKFQVEMSPVDGEFSVNDSIRVTGTAKAYAGNFIDGASVKYRVVRSTAYRQWFYYWGWRPSIPPKEIANGFLTTNNLGEFKISFEATPDLEAKADNFPIFTYTLYVDVTDINGETRSTSTNVQVGYQSLFLSNNIANEVNLQKGLTFNIKNQNLNGKNVKSSGSIEIVKLKTPKQIFIPRLWPQPDQQAWTKEEFKNQFPLEAYKDENLVENWPIETVVYQDEFETEDQTEISIETIRDWKPGKYRYTAKSIDKNGVEVIDVHYFDGFNPNSNKLANNEVLWVKANQLTAEPGEVIDLLVSSAAKNISVRYDVEAGNELLRSEIISLSNEQKLIKLKVEEKHRGNLIVHFNAVLHDRHFSQTVTINVPYTNKELEVKFSTFRNKLLPGTDEEWSLIIKDKTELGVNAELLATLYDASLDALNTPNSFMMDIYPKFYSNFAWNSPHGISTKSAGNKNYYWNKHINSPSRNFASLNYFGWSSYYYPRRDYMFNFAGAANGDGAYKQHELEETMEIQAERSRALKKSKNEMAMDDASFDVGSSEMVEQDKEDNLSLEEPTEQVDLSNVSARSNFNETAFFYPQLTTNKNGEIKINFTIPESLTKWKFLGLAHTQDLKIGTLTEEIITQKELMVVPNMPRFLREGDVINLATKISNVSDKPLNGAVELFLIDPITELPVSNNFKLDQKQKTFSVDQGQSTTVAWKVNVPYDLSTVKYKIVAQAGEFSDGEENVLPILSNRQLVTESMPMPIRGNETKDFSFDKLLNSTKSKSLKHHQFTLEFTSNPAWYAIQAMPYMMEYPHECAEQVFTRYYSNAIATHVMNSNPKVKEVVNRWKEESPEVFLSNLNKNQELKAVILEETPWVLDAQNESASKRNLAILLDMNRMSNELNIALQKIEKAQSSNGGWSWFPGMPESRYISQHILTGMGHLDNLGITTVRSDFRVWKMVKSAIKFMDDQIVSDYKLAKRYDENFENNRHLSYNQIQYLYARSYFPDVRMDNSTKIAVDYFTEQAKKYWLDFNIYAEGMIALAAHRFELKDLANDIVKSLKDRAIQHDEFGMYWKDFQTGYYWYQAPIETQALMIELFDEVANDQQSVEELKIWLLKQKQTTNWKTTKQTAEAVYALLLKGTDLLASDELVNITVGGQRIEYLTDGQSENPYQVNTEAGTGYFKTAWKGDDVKADMGKINVSKQSTGVAWGAAYWQYFEDLDKITFAESNLKLKKDIYEVFLSENGEELMPVDNDNKLEVGDKVRVRIELRTDRNLEYVHMKDMRGAGLEPLNVISRYKYQDGLGYYQSTKDVATHFFFDFIPKGTYVFEYDLRVQHKGEFSNGYATIQCMYAPEFIAHSDGVRINVVD